MSAVRTSQAQENGAAKRALKRFGFIAEASLVFELLNP
jgi:hypothetical protein